MLGCDKHDVNKQLNYLIFQGTPVLRCMTYPLSTLYLSNKGKTPKMIFKLNKLKAMFYLNIIMDKRQPLT